MDESQTRRFSRKVFRKLWLAGLLVPVFLRSIVLPGKLAKAPGEGEVTKALATAAEVPGTGAILENVKQELEALGRHPVDQEQIKIPYPVFVPSLFKSGTSSIHAYFECGGQASLHHGKASKCMRKSIAEGKPPFIACGNFDVFSDATDLSSKRDCYDPAVRDLDTIYAAYPNATMLLVVRDSYEWIDSVERWKIGNWHFLSNLQRCKNLWPEQPAKELLSKEDLREFYLWQVDHVRQFASTHPSMTFIEVSIDSDETGNVLEERIGISSSCWGQVNQNKWVPPAAVASG